MDLTSSSTMVVCFVKKKKGGLAGRPFDPHTERETKKERATFFSLPTIDTIRIKDAWSESEKRDSGIIESNK